MGSAAEKLRREVSGDWRPTGADVLPRRVPSDPSAARNERDVRKAARRAANRDTVDLAHRESNAVEITFTDPDIPPVTGRVFGWGGSTLTVQHHDGAFQQIGWDAVERVKNTGRRWRPVERTIDPEAGGDRLYNLLALFDTRDGTQLADLVRSAREGWERSGPSMQEDGAWEEFDARWGRFTSEERLELARRAYLLAD